MQVVTWNENEMKIKKIGKHSFQTGSQVLVT